VPNTGSGQDRWQKTRWAAARASRSHASTTITDSPCLRAQIDKIDPIWCDESLFTHNDIYFRFLSDTKETRITLSYNRTKGQYSCVSGMYDKLNRKATVITDDSEGDKPAAATTWWVAFLYRSKYFAACNKFDIETDGVQYMYATGDFEPDPTHLDREVFCHPETLRSSTFGSRPVSSKDLGQIPSVVGQIAGLRPGSSSATSQRKQAAHAVGKISSGKARQLLTHQAKEAFKGHYQEVRPL
jgi:hypothetical protein